MLDMYGLIYLNTLKEKRSTDTKNHLFKVALGVSPQFFFFIWTHVLNHNLSVEIKQFSRGDIKQNNISTFILLIKYLIYQWDQRHLQGSWVVCIFFYIMKFMLYLISNRIFVCINHRDTFYSNNKWCAQKIIEFTDEKLKPKVQIEDGFIYIMWWGRILIWYSIYR